MRTPIPYVTMALALAQPIAFAQRPAVDTSTATVTAPGKKTVATKSEITATIVGIDKATRNVTLKGPKGRTMDVYAGDEVKNFEQMKVGDNVVVQYVEALTLELKKGKGATGETETTAAARAKPGERPGGAVGREVNVMADIVAIDSAKSMVTLKGPRGNLIDLRVDDPAQLKLGKVGDQVRATYTEALAVSVTAAPAARK